MREPPGDGDSHLAPLPGTGWSVWRAALLRSAGFPADGLERFSAAACAETADALLDGKAEPERFAAAFEQALRSIAEAVHEVAADPLFREAVTWQNPDAAATVAGVLRDGPHARRNQRRRRREEIVAKYCQRYTAKNDTVGFFGPMCWVGIDPGGGAVAGRHGPGLVRGRTVVLERWALGALAARLAEDLEVRPWLPVTLQPQLSLHGLELRYPNRPPVRLSGLTAALLASCDGRRSAREVARRAVDAGGGRFRRESDVYVQLDGLVSRGVLRWGIDLPMDLSAETALRKHLEGIGHPAARERAVAPLDRLCAARDRLAAAAGPEEVAAALAELDAVFVAVTGLQARQRPGETYAGRTLCHLEAVRDLEMTFGGPLLAALAPLEPLLRSARWLTAAMADTYLAALTDLYRDLAADAGSPEVPFGQFWYLAHGLLFGDERPAEAVVAEFVRRWASVLGLASLPPGTRRLDLSRQELSSAVADAFPADRPGWAAARIHSPDIHLCASSPEALARGELTVVLGELHIGWAAFDTHFFALGHPNPDELHAAMLRDVSASRVQPLIPDDWPRNTARNAEWMRGPTDVQLGFAPAPGGDPDRLLPVTALTVVPRGERSSPLGAPPSAWRGGGDRAAGGGKLPPWPVTGGSTPATSEGSGELVVRAGDGRSWPLVEMFAGLLGIHAFDTWKLAGAAGHTPRITVDGLVLVRECWRTTVGEGGLAEVTGERERYLATRAWARALGLPERVFVRVGTEIKPCYVDLTSPLYTRILCNLLRSAKARGGEGVELLVTEMLPQPDQAWLEDTAGRRYCSELRLQIRDPATAPGG